jgi:hypothetical protein
MGPHDDVGHLSPAGDEEAELAVELTGELRELARQVVGDDPLRRDAPPVELPDALDLGRSEAGQVAVNLFDGCSLIHLNLCGLTRFSIRSRKVDQAFVRKGAMRFFVSFAPQEGHAGAASPTFMIFSKP